MNLPNKKEALATFEFQIQDLKERKEEIEEEARTKWGGGIEGVEEYRLEAYALIGEITATYRIMGWEHDRDYFDDLVYELTLNSNLSY